MNTIPTLTEQDIRTLVGEQSFQRGQRYFGSDAIFDTRREGMSLKARCQGSRSAAYRVEVTFNNTEITDTDCSCPIGNYCKHVAALLLTWLAHPEEFLEQQEIEIILGQCDKAALIDLIKQMLRRDPDLDTLVLAMGQKDMPADSALYHQMIEAAFRHGGDEWGAEADVADELQAIKEHTERYMKRKDYPSATIVCEAIVLGVIDHYDEYRDGPGELLIVINDCIEELTKCLREMQGNSALRAQSLRVLFEIERFDIEAGGIGFGDGVSEPLLEDTTAEERHSIADWVREALSKHTGKDEFRKYTSQLYGGLLLELEADTLDDETYLRICRETGRFKDTVERLLKLGRVDEAILEALQSSDYDLLTLADLFVKYGEDARIELLMQERIWKSRDSRILEWLYKRYKARRAPAAALLQAELKFRDQRPTLESYKQVRQLAIEFGQWEKIRPELLASVQSLHSDILIEIALDEEDFAPAQIVLKYDRISAHYYSHKTDRVFNQLKAFEATQADKVLTFYRLFVEYLVAQRNRQCYEEACRCLIKMRTLYEKLGRHDAWANYISELREQTHTLRALKEVMANAGL